MADKHGDRARTKCVSQRFEAPPKSSGFNSSDDRAKWHISNAMGPQERGHLRSGGDVVALVPPHKA
jgi:hypothetical protein